MSSIIENSWNNFSEEYSKTYLHDADQSLPKKLVNFIFDNFKNSKIIDIGCGNCRFYENLLEKKINSKFEFEYQGYDISKPLLKAANEKFGIFENFKCEETTIDFSNILKLEKKYDIAIAIHVAEICYSIERLFDVLTKKSDTIAIIWFEYPRFDFSDLEIKNYVTHDTAEKEIYSPYLRNRYSKSYLKHLLDRFSLEIVNDISNSEKDKLTIYIKK